MQRPKPLILGAIALGGLVPTAVMAQHVHGVIDLGVVLEDRTLVAALNAPLSDVVGFEHAPKTDEQTALVQQAAVMLADPEKMFGLAAQAGCSISNVTVDSPDFFKPSGGGDHHEQHGQTSHDGHHEDHDGHADDGHHEEQHAEHHDDEHHGEEHHDEHHDEETHSEINATYEWECSSPSDLQSLELRFIDAFASAEQVNAQILTAKGAKVTTIAEGAKSVSLSP